MTSINESYQRSLSPITIRCKQSHPEFSLLNKLCNGGIDTIHHILFVCKDGSQHVVEFLSTLINMFFEYKNKDTWNLYIEDSIFVNISDTITINEQHNVVIHKWEKCQSDVWRENAKQSDILSHSIDLIISLGGDGTVLYAAWQFQCTTVPPILPVYVSGSLGFLTVFDTSTCIEFIKNLMNPNPDNFCFTFCYHQRMRLRCSVFRHCNDSPNNHSLMEVFHVLNEVVIDRGPNPYMTTLQVFGDGHLLTTSHSDGLIVATPTGSTAYSMSAGGSIVDNSIPSILLTPICSHTLSFRPIHVRDSMEIKIVIPLTSRHTAWASFDGRHRVELFQGDSITITVSNYPVTTLCNKDQTLEWFGSLSKRLGWNTRERIGTGAQ